jgi:hypothetical protein
MTDPVPEELRLALVLNGGVSLAVWMGGVTHELDLLRRASGAPEEQISFVRPDDRPIWRRWREAAGSRRVVIDVVAGSSAGGINGALLATAIARGTSLDPDDADSTGPALRGLWERAAGLETGKLLAGEQPEYPASVLDGNFFAREVGAAFDSIRTDVGTPNPMTLFLTATAVGSADVPYADAYHHAFTVADHRRLYRFEADETRTRFVIPEKDFVADPAEDFTEFAGELKRSARATAS